MALRLPHVLVLMALVLAAGVVGVAVLAPELGVAGVVVVDAPWAGDEELSALAAARDGVVLVWPVGAGGGAGPLEPFGLDWAADRAARGDLTALYSLDPRLVRRTAAADAAGRPAWRVVVDTLATLPPSGRVPWGVSSAAELLAAQGGTRPFAVALALDATGAAADPATPKPAAGELPPVPGRASAHATSVARPLDEVVAPLLEALSGLPSYRRSTLVVLGRQLQDGRGRLALRLECPGPGAGGEPAFPGLADLLETRP